MGFWSGLGKIALQAAPYVAAPFTGGASLALTPVTQKLGQEWAQHDANANAAKGLAPSSFDNILGKVSGVAGAASSLGAFNGLSNMRSGGGGGDDGGAASSTSSIANRIGALGGGGGGGIGGTLSTIMGGNRGGQTPPYAPGGNTQGGGGLGNWQGALSSIMNNMNWGGGGGNTGGNTGGGYNQTSTTAPRAYNPTGGPVMPRGGYGYNQNPLNQLDQSAPNLSQALFQGRQTGLANQPFRSGYNVNTMIPGPGSSYTTTTNPMPPIYDSSSLGPSNGMMRRRQIQPQAAY